MDNRSNDRVFLSISNTVRHFPIIRIIQDGEAKEKVRNFEISTKIETIDFSYQFHAHRGGRD